MIKAGDVVCWKDDPSNLLLVQQVYLVAKELEAIDCDGCFHSGDIVDFLLVYSKPKPKRKVKASELLNWLALQAYDLLCDGGNFEVNTQRGDIVGTGSTPAKAIIAARKHDRDARARNNEVYDK